MSNRDLCAVISLISSKMEDNEEIIGRELVVVYDEILPDLYVDIELDDEVRKKYGINKKCKLDSVLYDVYADRIREVGIVYPDGKVGLYDVNYKEDSRDDELYCCTWQVPYIKIGLYGIVLEVSLLDLVVQGAKVFIKRYE